MPGFHVLGCAPGKIEAMVANRVRAQEKRLKCPPRDGSTEVRATKHRERLHAAPPRTQVSPEFDAPQFCRDWAAIARRAGFEHLVLVSPNGEQEAA